MPKKASFFKSHVAPEDHAGLKFPSWLATLHYGGKRERKRFRQRGDADAWIEERKAQLEKMGVEVRGLSRDELSDAQAARKELGGESLCDAVRELKAVRDVLGTGAELASALEQFSEARSLLGGRVGLVPAVQFWTAHHPDGAVVTLGELTDAYMAAKSRKRPSYFKNVKSKCGQFVATFGANTPAASIMPDTLAGFMETRGKAPATRKGWRVFFLGLFGMGVEKFGLDGNPAERLERVDDGATSDDDATFYTVEEVEKLLRAAEDVAPAFAPALALLFFAGIRPHELTGSYTVREDAEDSEGTGEVIGGLDWRFVGVNGEVVVTRSTSKTKRYRRIPIPRNLRAWLKAYGGNRRGRVVPNPQAWRRARDRITAAAGVDWLQDGARHSFATYHWGLHQDRAALESAMGHSGDTNTLEKYYTAYADKGEARRFWSIMPHRSAAAE